jgi:hypothetical protein
MMSPTFLAKFDAFERVEMVCPQGLNRLRKNSGPGRKDVPQGLKPDVFSIIYGTTKVVP